MIKMISAIDKDMSQGHRNISGTPLNKDEIALVKNEIKRICADEDKFVFNDVEHLSKSTCYNFEDDLVYVTRNIFPDTKYGSTHPRDLMSVASVLAHEYYGHRIYRDEYLNDLKIENKTGKIYHTKSYWEDECRASITACQLTPNLTQKEKSDLIMDAIYRAKENGQLIELDDYMKGVLYGNYVERKEKNISNIGTIKFIRETDTEEFSKSGIQGNEREGACGSDMSEVSGTPDIYDDFGR